MLYGGAKGAVFAYIERSEIEGEDPFNAFREWLSSFYALQQKSKS